MEGHGSALEWKVLGERGVTHLVGSTDTQLQNGCRWPALLTGEGYRAQGAVLSSSSSALLPDPCPYWDAHILYLRLIPVAPFSTCSTCRGAGGPCLSIFHMAQW